jgi:hypothetical protein
MNEIKQPTAEEIKQCKIKEDEHQVYVPMWHPQWGGYVGKCLVIFSKKACEAGKRGYGCFEVLNWHDGQFPTDNQVDTKHYCNAVQLIEFGTQILEAQSKRQVLGGKPITMHEWDRIVLKKMIERLNGVLAEDDKRIGATEHLQSETEHAADGDAGKS